MHVETLRKPGPSQTPSRQHLLTGVAVTAGAVMVSAVMARRQASEADPEAYSDYQEGRASGPPKAFAFVWPPLVMALTLSGLRLWTDAAARRAAA
jgi:benzodiazapine receptor